MNKSGFTLAALVIVGLNVAWIGFVVWMIYTVVMWLVSK